jgi:hypothetical protein
MWTRFQQHARYSPASNPIASFEGDTFFLILSYTY